MKKVKTAIIGAGSAGLSALRQVSKQTNDYVLVNHGPLGTTCARTGCMPSKVLIEIARDYHKRLNFNEMGISGANNLNCDIPAALQHVRKLKDRFTSGMIDSTRKLAGRKLIEGRASFLDANSIKVRDEEIRAEQIVIATGSRPVFPGKWKQFSDRILTTGNFFEQTDLPRRIAVIGLGPVGLELGQALNRLGIHAPGFSLFETIGGITDREINRAACSIIGREMTLRLGAPAEIEQAGDYLKVNSGDSSETVDKVLLAMGVKPDIEGLGLENLGVELNEQGLPVFNPATSQIGDLPVYIAGDVNGCRPILHEALDEGFIAGRNAVTAKAASFCRRTPLRMVFSDPQIAATGKTSANLKQENIVIGEVDFSQQSRAVVEGKNRGILRVYVDKHSANIMGAEMVVPDAEHLSHIIALAVQKEMTAFEMLQMPFYHPTVEEGLRSALRQAAGKVSKKEKPEDMLVCDSRAEPPLC
ncbi:MAG: dihydrolipoyl dehydrogenase [Verrucomicrobiota bacterium]